MYVYRPIRQLLLFEWFDSSRENLLLAKATVIRPFVAESRAGAATLGVERSARATEFKLKLKFPRESSRASYAIARAARLPR